MNITLDDIAAPMVDWGTLQKLKELGDIVNLLVVRGVNILSPISFVIKHLTMHP